MKVTGAGSAGATSGARSTQRAPADGFAPSGADEAGASAPTARAASLGAVSSLDALLALQETLGPLERRRRAVRRAGHILDVLDDLKLAILDGDGGDGAVLHRLGSAVREARNQTDDAELDDLLEQIEIRAAVELAKREVATAA